MRIPVLYKQHGGDDNNRLDNIEQRLDVVEKIVGVPSEPPPLLESLPPSERPSPTAPPFSQLLPPTYRIYDYSTLFIPRVLSLHGRVEISNGINEFLRRMHSIHAPPRDVMVIAFDCTGRFGSGVVRKLPEVGDKAILLLFGHVEELKSTDEAHYINKKCIPIQVTTEYTPIKDIGPILRLHF